jgi:hypothetical protein
MSVLNEIIENKGCLEVIYNDKKIIDTLFQVITSGRTNQNVSEALGFLIFLMKSALIESLKVPTTEFVDEVNTEESNVVNNTILGEAIMQNLPGLLANFDADKDTNEVRKIEGTFGETYVPLGMKR